MFALAEFSKIKKENPYWSSYTCFAAAVENKKLSAKIIRKAFLENVNKDDYSKETQKAVLRGLYGLTGNQDQL